MALQLQDLMMQLHPLAPINLTGSENMGMERQRLQLMREQFENTKQQQQQQLELGKLEEGGRMAREKMVQDRLLAEKKATEAAAVQAKQQELLGKFTELNGKGDIEGARAMVPLLSHAGLEVSLEGEQNGLPRYRIGPDPEQAARSQGAIGYPTDDSGTLAEGPGIASSSDMTPEQLARVTGGGTEQRAATDQAVAQPPLAVEPDIGPPEAGVAPDTSPIKPEYQNAARALDPLGSMRPSRLAAAPTEQPDYTGGVPKNVIDTGAIQQQTLARLNPALDAITRSYPPEYRGSVGETANAIAGMGLPGEKSLETFDKLRSSPDSIIRAQIQADAQKGEQGDKALAAAGKESHRRYMDAYKGMAETAGKTYGVAGIIDRRSMINRAVDVLKSGTGDDDYLAGAPIARLMGERTTKADIERALGTSAAGFFERIENGLYHEAIGGLAPKLKDSLLGVLANAKLEDEKRAGDFQANIDKMVEDPSTDPDMARGLRDYVKVVIPSDLRDSYQASKKKAAKGAASSAPGSADTLYTAPPAARGATAQNTPADADFQDELMVQGADAGLDERALRGVINAESGGDPAAHNPSGATGLIQFMPSIAKAMGTSTEEIGKMTAAQQVPLVIRYLKDRGIDEKSSQGDMYVAVAAGGGFVGKPDSTVVYKKDSPGWQQNPAWRPKDGGDITIADLKRFGGGKTEPDAAPAASAPAPASGGLSEKLKAMRERLGR